MKISEILQKVADTEYHLNADEKLAAFYQDVCQHITPALLAHMLHVARKAGERHAYAEQQKKIEAWKDWTDDYIAIQVKFAQSEEADHD